MFGGPWSTWGWVPLWLLQTQEPVTEKDPLLMAGARVAEKSTDWGPARAPEQVISAGPPPLCLAGRRRGHSGSVLPTWVTCGGAGTAGLPTSPALPASQAAQGGLLPSPGKSAPRKYKEPRQASLVCGEMAAQSGGKWCSAKSRNQNYAKGKPGRVQEIKTAREGCASNTHTVLL